MTIITSLRNKFAPASRETTTISDNAGQTTFPAEHGHGDSKTLHDPEIAESSDAGLSGSDQVPSEDVQDGVRQVEALTLVWTKTSLGVAYIL